MNNKPVIYGVIGFVSGIILTILIGFFGMSGMMWGRWGMMHDWWREGCQNYPPRELPNNPNR
ncbi:MAG: hypothetical protein D6756_02510 [Cyanobacteria bacterium J083]|nr:MAG: hypothetical protein D6756_02510 [Cyanobacteria bacterium J083]